jgi:polyhydroxyalkanoate synthesis regulator phasin
METKVSYSKQAADSVDEYREAVKRLIQTEIGNIIDEEIRKAALELLEEQKKAIRQVVEEHRLAIRQAVEEEKKAIWARVEELRRSILKLGLG